MSSVQVYTIEATVNSILRNHRDLWPGGLSREAYNRLGLMACCRHGELGYNVSECRTCHKHQWYASSCGDRHCPGCLGPRQAQWCRKVCSRLPDCPHFHVVFTVPEEFRAFFKSNYRVAAEILFQSASATLRQFMANNAGIEGGWMAVLHTWGRALTWHPHLHVLVSAGGRDLESGAWKPLDKRYLFPVKALSKVFRARMVEAVEDLDQAEGVVWPEECDSLDARRDWRVKLSCRGWNVHSAATLRNTRAVVRYLARYTSQIAISNKRIRRINREEGTVSFDWKNYREDGRRATMTLKVGEFLRRFSSHLLPKGLRRVRYYGMLGKPAEKTEKLGGAPATGVGGGDDSVPLKRPCPHCHGSDWRPLLQRIKAPLLKLWLNHCKQVNGSFSLVAARAGP